MLKQRIITALILIPITVVLVFFLPPSAFCILTILISLMALWEWSHLMGLQIRARLIYLTMASLIFFIALFIPALIIFIIAFIWWLCAFLLLILYPFDIKGWSKSSFLCGLMGFLVIVPCWAAINFIRNANDGDGIYALLFLFILIWGADSAAYFVGKKWGTTKLSPTISPGKTLQGLYGALFFSFLIALSALVICQIPLQVWPWSIALTLITVLFSVIGDLFESMLKRNANLKDSGQLLPGHGGLLDRIDSLTAATPIFALGAMLLGMYLD